MKQQDYHKRYKEDFIMGPYKCGCTAPVRIYGKQSIISCLSRAERLLCPKCRNEKLKKENKHTRIPMNYYDKHLKHARNIVTGERDYKKQEIEVWLPWSKYDEYIEASKRIYFEIHNTPVSHNRSILTIIMRGERTKDIKEDLKKLGAKWKNWYDEKYRAWGIVVSVYLEIDERHNYFIPPEQNSEYYSFKKQLEKLGCIADYSKINW